MEIHIARLKSDADATIGALYINWDFVCHTLEDEARKVKVQGETRINSGIYKLGFRKVLSGLTQKYRKRFTWFTWHLEIKDVEGFKYVYLHIGNSDKDSDACILLGQWDNENIMYITHSAVTYQRVYLQIAKALEGGEDVTLTILDEDQRIEDLQAA